MLLLNGFALGDQLAALQVTVDLQDGRAAVGAPFADGAQFFPELLFRESGNIVYR